MGCSIEYYNTLTISDSDISVTTSNRNGYATNPTREERPSLEKALGTFEKNSLDPDKYYYFYDTDNTYWFSSSLANEYGEFKNIPSIKYTFSSAKNLPGLSIFFSNDTTYNPFWIRLIFTHSDGTVTDIETTGPKKGWFTYDDTVNNCKSAEIRIIAMRYPYIRAKIFRVEFGIVNTFTGDDVISGEMTEGINPVSVETETHTSIFQIKGENAPMMKKRHKYDIYHTDVNGDEHFMGQHISTDIVVNDDVITLKGASLLKLLEYYYIPSEKVEVYEATTFLERLKSFIDGRNLGIFISYPDDVKNIIVKGRFSNRVSLKTAFTALALACNLYIDCNSSNRIEFKHTNKLLTQTDNQFYIPETQVFSGDNFKYNTPYRYLKLTTRSENDRIYTFTVTNPAVFDSETSKDISCELYSSHTQESGVDEMLSSESLYYFNNTFYKANTLCNLVMNSYAGIVGKKGVVNGHECILIRRKINLDGEKLYSENEYIYIKEAT